MYSKAKYTMMTGWLYIMFLHYSFQSNLILDFLHLQEFTLLRNIILDCEILHGKNKCKIIYGWFWGFLFVFCKGYKCIKSTCPTSPICLTTMSKDQLTLPHQWKEVAAAKNITNARCSLKFALMENVCLLTG